MPKIQLLPTNLINQIAAGEVIERPASVIKELVDNSIDAGATQIEVTLRKAGRESLSITDNGSGMDPEDAALALERHATSKIRSFEDLTEVMTMGFRGEALPSIGSISYLTLTTRTASSETAHQIKVEGGRTTETTSVAAPVGTSILIEHLFYNVPARRKFLKSDATELGHCVSVIKAVALAHCQIGFRLREGRRVIIDLPAGQTLRERVTALCGDAMHLLDVSAYEGQAQLQGLIAPPSHLEPNRQKLFFFVNGRPVDSRVFQLALRDAYGATLSRGQYPAAVLFLNVPPAEVDVNVHPAKREIRFRKESEKIAFLIKALGMTLASSATPNTPSQLPFALQTSENGLPSLATPPPIPLTPTSAPHPHATHTWTAAPFPAPRLEPTPPPFAAPANQPLQTRLKVAEAPSSRHSWQFISFLHSAWALYGTPEGLAIVSIAAAQERIAYELVAGQLAKGEVRAQTLLIPALLQLDRTQVATLEANLERFTAQGFIIAPFGSGTYRLEAIPSWATSEQGISGTPEQILLQELAALAEETTAASDEQALQRTIAHSVARHAHTPITHVEGARHLIDRLLACQQPLKGLDGSPTLWLISLQELEKRFFK